jgi:hypothetical protein
MSKPITAEGTIVGTFQYMAPEQLEGKEADARSDIWALGCVLYEMATGKQAFEGASQASLISAIMKDEPRPITELQPLTPPALDRVARHCLRKSPDDRFQSARDLAFDLESISAMSQIVSDPLRAAHDRRRTASRLAGAFVMAAALLGLAFVASHMLWKPPPPTQPIYQRLTFRRGTIDRARFAPDGQTVVYDARWDGKLSEVFTLRPGNPESRPLGIADARLLAVSPSGELAVQLRPIPWSPPRNKGTLARVPLGGGEPRSLREYVLDADWTPDGSQLTVVLESDPACIQLPSGTTIGRDMYSVRFIRTMPDGRGVAFWRPTGTDNGGVLALIAPGTPERALCPIDYLCTGIAWNPRTHELWYSEVDTVGSTSLCSVAMDGQQRRLLQLAGVAALQDVATDGRVLISVRSTRRAIEVLGPGETEERDLSWLDRSSPYDLSPDGRMLVFAEEGTPGGRTGAVYLRPTDGSPAVRLGEGRYGSLSPDRKWVAVWIGNPSSRLRLLPVGAGEPHDVATGDVTMKDSPFFFPDGRRLLFVGQRGDSAEQFFTVPVEGGTPHPVTPPGWGLWAGQRPLSPDGRFVAATGNAPVVPAARSNYVFPAGGGLPRPVPGDAEGQVVLGWTGDSRGLYVFQRGEVPARIYQVDLATGRRQLWKELGPADRAGVSSILYALIAADGRSYGYTFDRTQDDLYLVTGLK